jgi:hypothetical protein
MTAAIQRVLMAKFVPPGLVPGMDVKKLGEPS